MSLKLQQASGTGSGSGRRIGPASKTNRLGSAASTEVIDVDALDDKPLSQMNQKSTNSSNEIKTDVKKSLIPISTNEKNNQVSLSMPTTTSNEIKNGKDSNSSTPSTTNDKNDNNKSTEKNGHNNDQSKTLISQQSQKEQSQKELQSTNGHKNNEGNNKKTNILPTNGNNDEQKESKTKENLTKNKDSTNEEPITISTPVMEPGKPNQHRNQKNSTPVIESEKEAPAPKSKKLPEKEKKKSNEEITSTNIDLLPQPTITPPLKRTSQRTAAIQANASLSSLANEKELKGFNEIGDDEMESLLLQIDTSEQVEKPTKSLLTPTKNIISNLEKKNDHENKTKIEAKKNDDFTQLTTKKLPIKATVSFSQSPITSTPDAKQQNSYLPRSSTSSIRSISGRRSLRPINKEYSFQNTTNYRESYRKIQTDFDCTGNTSLNVTVGSEIAQPEFISSSSSFSFFGRGKKRERTSPQQLSTAQKSPDHCELINDGDNNELDTSLTKRARLDFSGFFGIVASPVTMLRARLSRAKIQSTPILQDDIEAGVENFSGVVGEKHDNEYIEDNKDNCEDEDVETDELSMNDDNDENDKKNINDKSDAVTSEDNEIIVIERENTRRMCLLM